MSIISLKTLDGQTASEFSNYFREGILLKKGAKIQLISMSINKNPGIVIDSSNNKIVWRIGTKANKTYMNHHVTIPSGSYTGDQLGIVIGIAMNNATLIGNYKGMWRCPFSEATPHAVGGGYDLVWGQKNVPVQSAQQAFEYTYSKPALEAPTFAQNQLPAITNITSILGDSITDLNYIAYHEAGIFSNGGSHDMIVQPDALGTGYGRAICGWSRNICVFPERYGYNPTTDPAAAIRYGADKGADPIFLDGYLDFIPAGPGVANVKCMQLTQRAGTSFPNANWAIMTQKDVNQPIGTALPTLTFGTDHIRLRCTITGNLNQVYSVSHDNAGNGVFVADVVIASTSSTVGFNSTIKESMFPLLPITSASPGLNTDYKTVSVQGVYDDEIIIPPTSLSAQSLIDYKAEMEDDTDVSAQGLRELSAQDKYAGYADYNDAQLEALDRMPSQLQLGAPVDGMTFYLFGKTLPDLKDFVQGGGLIPNTQIPILADDVGSIGDTIGMHRAIYHANIAAGQAARSTLSIDFDIDEPSLTVELPDFNIKSYNGATGDIIKAVSVVPKERLSEGKSFGTLHYAQQFPLPIDLNLSHEQNINQIRVRVRDSQGVEVKGLRSPTNLVLYLENNNQSPQDALLEKMESIMGNRQEQMIDRNNNEIYPKV
jgi:hypothetical protein